MGSDIVNRLRIAHLNSQQFGGSTIFLEAADHIAAQALRIAELEANAKCACAVDNPDDVCLHHAGKYSEVRAKALEEAAILAEYKAKDYELQWQDLRNGDRDRRFAVAVATRLRDVAGDIRAAIPEKKEG